MRIIPAIDIIGGKCVRLTKGDYSTKKIYNKNPLELAKSFEEQGIKYLHLVDLDGAKAKEIINLKILESIASNTNLKIDFGGGVKSEEAVQSALNAGANQVTGGSIAAKDPVEFDNWIEKFGAEKLILGADALDRKIATDGWLITSKLDLMTFLFDYEKRGITDVICTDIAKDGMLKGPSFGLYAEIIERTNLSLIASGGVSNLSDVKLLKKMGCSGVIVGKAIYEGRITVKQLVELC
jgi:phosphoribosylformimino-5-aminoimidazole carboxamide ribotide isomerase